MFWRTGKKQKKPSDGCLVRILLLWRDYSLESRARELFSIHVEQVLLSALRGPYNLIAQKGMCEL